MTFSAKTQRTGAPWQLIDEDYILDGFCHYEASEGDVYLNGVKLQGLATSVAGGDYIENYRGQIGKKRTVTYFDEQNFIQDYIKWNGRGRTEDKVLPEAQAAAERVKAIKAKRPNLTKEERKARQLKREAENAEALKVRQEEDIRREAIRKEHEKMDLFFAENKRIEAAEELRKQ